MDYFKLIPTVILQIFLFTSLIEKYVLNLQLISKLHVHYIQELNQQSYHPALPAEQSNGISAGEVTGFLFEDDCCILQWIREHIDWKSLAGLLLISEQQWQSSRIKIITQKSAK